MKATPGAILSHVGLLGLLLIMAGCRAAPADMAPSLLLITIDTLRADHVSAYGYHRTTTPTIDTLAARGVRFATMISPLPETGPSCATLLTGRWPAELGMRGNGDRLPDDTDTLATMLALRNYRTGAFVSGYPLVDRLSGLARGFQIYDDDMPDARGRVAGVQRQADKTASAALQWLSEDTGRPFFAWVHFYDVHGDYAPGPPYEDLFQGESAGQRLPLSAIPEYQRLGGATDTAFYIARYDGEIRRVDDQVKRLLEFLERSGRRHETVVAISSDHGESLTEHGYFFDHGNELYMPSAHVPFIVNGPGIPARARPVTGIARGIDAAPTLLELLDVPGRADLPGRSLVPSWRHDAPSLPYEGFSEARFKAYPALTPGADVEPKLASRDDRFTALLRLARSRLELFDRLRDPAEERDLAPLLAASPAGLRLVTDVEAALRRQLADAGSGASDLTRVFTPERRQALIDLVEDLQ